MAAGGEGASLRGRPVVGLPKIRRREERAMSRISLGAALAAAALAALLSGADGQQAALEDPELLGMRLFNQSCRVCHTKPQLTSPLYGPELSQRSLAAREAGTREAISKAPAGRPGFKSHSEPAQIEAIVAYLKTIPAPPAAAGPAR